MINSQNSLFKVSGLNKGLINPFGGFAANDELSVSPKFGRAPSFCLKNGSPLFKNEIQSGSQNDERAAN